MKVCLTIDLDNYQHYQSLVDTKLDGDPPSFYTTALPHFLDVFDEAGIKATFFAIGQDLGCAENRKALREAHARGHEIGNHSYTHPYNFRGLTRAEKEVEIDQGDAAIADAVGERPVGFRTPSCDVDLETLGLLADRGYLYDSSVFPSPMMWVFMLYGLVFVRHGSYQLGPPSAAFAPPRPYFPSATKLHRPRRSSADPGPNIIEIPISVATPLRIPFYSTLVRLLGPRLLDLGLSLPRREAELHMLFHMIELADFTGTPLADSIGNTPGIGVPFERRVRFVTHAAHALSRQGTGVPMRDIASAARANTLEGNTTAPTSP